MILFVVALIPLLMLGIASIFLPRRLTYRGCPWAMGLALIWLWLSGTGLLLPVYDRALQVDRWPTAPAATLAGTQMPVVLLGGGTELSGPDRSARPGGDSIEKVALVGRYFRNRSIIVSGGDPQHHGVAEADNYAVDLMLLGVPPESIIHENRSLNTYQNAVFVAKLLPATSSREIILVTTAQHMRRALLYFDRLGFVSHPVTPASHPVHWSVMPTLSNWARSAGAIHELIGIVQFHVYRAIGFY